MLGNIGLLLSSITMGTKLLVMAFLQNLFIQHKWVLSVFARPFLFSRLATFSYSSVQLVSIQMLQFRGFLVSAISLSLWVIYRSNINLISAHRNHFLVFLFQNVLIESYKKLVIFLSMLLFFVRSFPVKSISLCLRDEISKDGHKK